MTLSIVLIAALQLAMTYTAMAQKGSQGSPEPSGELSQFLISVMDVPLPGTAKRFDYQSVDESRSLLFIAHLGDNSVTIFDLKKAAVMKHLKDISRPHGILAVPKLDRVYISATGVNELQVLDEASMKIIARVPAGDYPDGIAYDPNTNRVFVSDEHGGTVTVVNAQENKVVATIPMGGEVGNTQSDPVSKHIFSAVQTTDELVEIDAVSMKIVSRYALGDCKGAHGFIIEPETHYAFVTGEENDSYVVVDLDTKNIIDRGKVGSGPDVLAYDRQYHLLYVSAESGVVSIFSVRKNATRKLAQGLLAPHAHTVAVDQATHKVYFPIEDINGKPVLRIMEPVISKVPTK